MTAPRSEASLLLRDEGPAVESEIVRDMIARRAVFLAPALVVACGAIGGVDAALSSAYAVAIVLVNFLLSAAIVGRAARISFALLMGAVLGGYLVRLAIVTAAVLAVRNHSWVELLPLGLTLIATHLGLLAWESKYVSASLAYPALKPTGRNHP